MFAQKEIDQLGERKRLLLLEAEVHRSIINLECESIRAKLKDLREAREQIGPAGPWLMAGSAFAGVLALRHWRRVAKWVPTIFATVRWIKKLRQG
jgi:hypothetical protein